MDSSVIFPDVRIRRGKEKILSCVAWYDLASGLNVNWVRGHRSRKKLRGQGRKKRTVVLNRSMMRSHQSTQRDLPMR